MADEDRIVEDFDETNGKVDGLEGDDNGALEDDNDDSLIATVTKNLEDRGDDAGDDPAVNSYSEEGNR